MTVRFDHISLSAKNPERMKDFLCELLGLEVGSRPNFSFDGYFLYAGEKDVIHLFRNPEDIEGDASKAQDSLNQNIVHHICFYSDDNGATMDRISKLNLKYSINAIPGSSNQQIFIRAPENLMIEIQVTPKD